MSAIAALVRTDGRPVSRQTLDRMSEALSAPGGPGALWAGETAGLLHRPMPSTPEDRFDRQPVVGADGRFVLVFDGRLDDRRELSGSLGIEARETIETPDSALALLAWEKWGEAAPLHLVGSFAFVVRDTVERSLFAAVSPSDARTLYYHSAPGHLALATMPRGLFVIPGIARAVDEVKVADFLLDLQDVGRSFFEGVSVLPPGHQLRFRNGTLDVHRFWSPLPIRPVRFRRDEEYLEAFLDLFDRVVRDQLRSVTPVAVSLSGGLDSSAVAATAALALASEGKRLLAFTEVPREGFSGPVPAGRYADETPLVTAIGRYHPNIDLTFVRTDGTSFVEGLEESFSHREAPYRNAFNRRWLEAVNAEARSRGARVVLTGVGGNATVSWDGFTLFADLVRRLRWIRAFREARHLAGAGGLPAAARTLVSLGILPQLPRSASAVIRRAWRTRSGRRDQGWRLWSLARPEYVADHRIDERARELSRGLLDRSLMSPGEGRAWLLGLGSGGSFEAGCRSQQGVDLRNPLFDVRLVEFCLGIPDDLFLREGRSRWLVRRAMEGRLPAEVLENRRRGLQAADWAESFQAALPLIPERLDSFRRNDLVRRAIDLPRLERLLRQTPWERSGEPDVLTEYSAALGRAVMIGSFVLWAEDEARRKGRA